MAAKIIKVINYISIDKSIKYRLEILQDNPMSFNCYGRTWAKQTQAILYDKEFVKTHNTIIKHERDPDNLKYAVMNVCKPVISQIKFKEIKRYFWKELLNFVKNE